MRKIKLTETQLNKLMDTVVDKEKLRVESSEKTVTVKPSVKLTESQLNNLIGSVIKKETVKKNKVNENVLLSEEGRLFVSQIDEDMMDIAGAAFSKMGDSVKQTVIEWVVDFVFDTVPILSGLPNSLKKGASIGMANVIEEEGFTEFIRILKFPTSEGNCAKIIEYFSEGLLETYLRLKFGDAEGMFDKLMGNLIMNQIQKKGIVDEFVKQYSDTACSAMETALQPYMENGELSLSKFIYK